MTEATAFSIKETAEQTGLSEDTIRYYEKIGLLPRAERKENRHRIYREEDISMIKLVTCLKKTGLSLDEMKPFLKISSLDNFYAFPELYERIDSHKENIKSQIAALQTVLDFIDDKMEHGGRVGKDGAETDCDTPAARSHLYK